MAGMDLPLKIVRQQISSAVDVIVQIALRDGERKITAISEVAGMEGDVIVLSDIFKFNQTGMDAEGKISGQHKATGIRPLFGRGWKQPGLNLVRIFSGPLLPIWQCPISDANQCPVSLL